VQAVIAALYVQTDGYYYGLPDVDPWDQARDARLYAGPWPVVAHPPCERWCQVARLVESLHAEKDERFRVGFDFGTFQAALAAVRTFGGVLEHPAYSLAWNRFELPEPTRGYWSASLFDPGWTTEVSQSAYGHPCRKRTWLYYVGDGEPPALNWSEPPVRAQVTALVGGHGNPIERWRAKKADGVEILDKNLSAFTPPAFRDVLIALARSARGGDR